LQESNTICIVCILIKNTIQITVVHISFPGSSLTLCEKKLHREAEHKIIVPLQPSTTLDTKNILPSQLLAFIGHTSIKKINFHTPYPMYSC
jgi:hypothetical protein